MIVDKILIAEDDIVLCEILKKSLEVLGYEVTATTSGKEALEAFKNEPMNLIVSDWTMPEMTGLEFCAEVRKMELESYPYFIILTGNSGKENHKLAMQSGVDDFLPKPLNTTELEFRLNVAKRILKFQQELNDLKAIIPICSYCKSIRRDDEYWQSVESFLQKNVDADVSHSICPDCYVSEVEPQLSNLKNK